MYGTHIFSFSENAYKMIDNIIQAHVEGLPQKMYENAKQIAGIKFTNTITKIFHIYQGYNSIINLLWH